MRTLLVATLGLAASCSGGHDDARRAPPFAELAAQCRGKDMGCPRPIFAVHDLKRALAYYRDVLGFKVDWEWGEPGEPTDFGSVTRGDATIFVGESNTPGVGALWVFTREVDKVYDEVRKKGAHIKMKPTNMPWGNRELHVLDADGNLIRFGGPVPKAVMP